MILPSAKIKNTSESILERRIDKTSLDKHWQKLYYYETISENP
tara:strand:- start:64 stop:192 length:129 start_codon:yes stop_codon:yes gene_type:complete